MIPVLKFECVCDGKWDAYSFIHDDGSSFQWRIRVKDNGMFTVSESDKELLHSVPPDFSTFEMAVDWCNEKESVEVHRVNCAVPPPTDFNLGAYQQAWHMAQTACNALGLDYEHTSPFDISEAIQKLKGGA